MNKPPEGLHRKAMTAAQWLAHRSADPAVTAATEARQKDVGRQAEERRREQAPLLRDLAAAGIETRDVWDLAGSADPTPDVGPVLLAHLARAYHPHTLVGIRSALVKASKAAGSQASRLVLDALVARLRAGLLPPDAAQETLAAISELARPADLPLLFALIRDQALGPGRLLLVANLTRSRNAAARKTLLALQEDPDLRREIVHRLKTGRKARAGDGRQR